jgi:O-antigen ligase/polysaccharide polymerase Wzy-like membrane protein
MQASDKAMSVHALGVRVRKVTFVPVYFGIFMLPLLAGYAFFGRGFAYLGFPPFFVGELGVVLALAALLSTLHQSLWRSPITWLFAVFAVWCAAQTIPYISEYGLAALRDAVIWGYGIYALAVASVVLTLNAIDKVALWYRNAIPAFLLISLTILVIQFFYADLIPQWPWGRLEAVGGSGGIPMVDVKMGDLAVHLAGIFAFVVLGVSTKALSLVWYFIWSIIAVAPAFLSRGAMVTMGGVVWMTAFLRPTRKYFYILLFVGGGVIAAYVTGLQVEQGARSGRVISVEQLWSNIESIVSPSSKEDLQGTKVWRQLWWDKIFDYTFSGKYFWTGKGFGINLADDDGFQVELDRSLRNPHNVHMAILARAGVPGLALWMLLQITFGLTLFFKYLKDRRLKRERLARVEAWTLLYWLAFLINGTFDVAIEGPQAGIWFWSVFGFGLALILTPGKPSGLPARAFFPVSTRPVVGGRAKKTIGQI